MLATDWTSLTAAGAFIAGLGVGILLTIRVGKFIAAFLSDIRKKEEE